jgi:uncharacterized protein (TIGR02172 family)
MTKGEFIAEGRTAEVYAWGPDHVLKLYREWWPLENIQYEIRICRAVHEAGITSPAVGDLIQVKGRYGLIYERIDGPSMEGLMFDEPHRLDEMARLFAHLQASLHSTVAAGLPSQRNKLLHHIELARRSVLNEKGKRRALDIMATLTDGNSVCHGDLYPGNVLISPHGATIIDWENASLGSPLADVARTLLAFDAAPLYIETEPKYGPLLPAIARFRDLYLDAYLGETGADLMLIHAWRIPIAADRLHEGVKIEEEYLISICNG